jgi:hypothetical protein
MGVAFFLLPVGCYPARVSSAGPHVGLCGDCAHARVIKSDRGSVFLLCQRSFSDSRFAKYPRLPVVFCRGYEQRQNTEPGQAD